MKLEQLDYHIPENLIATKPIKPRDESSLVTVNEGFEIIKFKEIINQLNEKDTLVFNNTKVINAHLEGKIKKRNVSVNLNKLIDKKKTIWSAFLKSNKKPIINEEISFPFDLQAKIVHIFKNNNTNFFHLKFNCNLENLKSILCTYGKTPLPPYIKKIRRINKNDIKDYQTIFAKKEGAVAAPTASLHFSDKLFAELKKKVNFVYVTLHVNGGTFLPIKTKNVFEHNMHSEFGIISKKSAKAINKYRKMGGRIIAVGTTVLRLLESSKDENGIIKEFNGETDIYIKPGSNINSVDGLITNFHTPRSSLLLLVYAFIGEKKTKKLYEYAIKKKLRFFSYGDACLLWKT